MLPFALLALCALLAGCAGETSTPAPRAQYTTLNDFSCKSCRIVIESIAFLGHPDDTVTFREDVLPARDSRGRFYLADRNGGAVHVFAPSGRLMKTFGKLGRGPGELMALRAIYVKAGDTLLVVGGNVVHVFSPDYKQVREDHNKGGSVDEFTSTILADGRLLLGNSRHRFTIIDTAGEISARVMLRGIDTAECGECGERVYREAILPGTIWSGPLNMYRIENNDFTGRFIRGFVREANWFREWEQEDIEARTVTNEFARPRVIGVRPGTDGLLWTHVSLIEDATGLTGIEEDEPRQMFRLWSRVVTHIEAIDPVARELLAGTVSQNIIYPLVGDYSARQVVNESGDWSWEILRFRIEGHK